MSEDKDYVADTQFRARSITGHDMTPDELATEFARKPIGERVDVLETLQREARSRVYSSPREAARHRAYTSKLHQVHERLRKVER